MTRVERMGILLVLLLSVAIPCNASEKRCTKSQREIIATKLAQRKCPSGPRNCTCLSLLMPEENATRFLNCEWNEADNQTLWDHWKDCKQELRCKCTGNLGFYHSDPHITPHGHTIPGFNFPKDFGNNCSTNVAYKIDSDTPWAHQPWCYIPCDQTVCPHVPRYKALGQLGQAARRAGQNLCFSFEACGGIDYLADSKQRCNERGGFLIQEQCSCDIGKPCTPGDGDPTTSTPDHGSLWEKYFITILVAVIAVSITLVILSMALATYCSAKKQKRSKSELIGTADPLLLGDTLDMPIMQLQNNLDALVQALQSNDFMLAPEDIRLGRRLGAGSAGQVFAGYLASDTDGEANVALKETFQAMMEQDTTEILHEVEVMMKLKHRNIVQLYGLWTREGEHIGTRVYMVMELCEGGNLRQRMIKGGLTATQKLRWACDISDGVKYLHSRNPCVVHRDLKPANVVLTRGGERAKLVDFGSSRPLATAKKAISGMVGTVVFMAPELMQHASDATDTPGVSYDASVDIYSFAILLFELWTEREAYSGLTPLETIMAVTRHNKRPSLELGRQNCDNSDPDHPVEDSLLLVHDDVCELIEGMWETEPADRPTAMVVSKSLHAISAAAENGDTTQ